MVERVQGDGRFDGHSFNDSTIGIGALVQYSGNACRLESIVVDEATIEKQINGTVKRPPSYSQFDSRRKKTATRSIEEVEGTFHFLTTIFLPIRLVLPRKAFEAKVGAFSPTSRSHPAGETHLVQSIEP